MKAGEGTTVLSLAYFLNGGAMYTGIILHRCMGGGGGSAPAPTPPPAPTPSPTPQVVNPVATAQDRAKNLASFQYGLASTIKTGALGITGKGPELKAPSVTGISTLGGAK